LSFKKRHTEIRYFELGELHVSDEVGDLLAEVVIAAANGESESEECEPRGNLGLF